MTQASFHPPRVAAWLIELFTPYEQSESIPGDLLEEFSELAAKSGAAYARQWFWRQTVPTISHLVRSGFQSAPWSTAGVVLGGLLLVQLGHIFSEWAIRAGIEKFVNHSVFFSHHVHVVVFVVNAGVNLIRLTVPMLIGGIIALASKKREMLATITLSLICSVQAITGFWTFVQGNGWGDYRTLHPSVVILTLLSFFGGLFAIVVGGVIVRRHRFRSLRPA
jgi:hypothetical protein